MSQIRTVRVSHAIVFSALLLPAFAQNITPVVINDPAYGGMRAFNINIPAGWKFQGTVLPGPDCSHIPFPVFEAYSPDGLQEIRLQPVFHWTFHPSLRAFRPLPGCVNIDGPISAEDFLKRYEEMIGGDGIRVIGPMAVGQAYQQRVGRVANNMNHISPDLRGSAEAAAVRIETINGTFVIEQRLRVYIACRVNTTPRDHNGGGCEAHVDVERAPKGKLDALCALVDAQDLTKTPYEAAWFQTMQRAVSQIENQEALRYQAAIARQQQAASVMLRKMHEDFMATSQRNHQAFMAQQASRFHASMNAANSAMNARSTAASDWVDYSLNRQTVTGSGGTAKVSNSYSQTWSNGQNQWYQTNDPNSNPNGVLPGNWTLNTKVHGNGQPQ